ncbi:MAG: dehydrogenase [Opitutales bacterium]|jgi:predicted dehydrogenase|nr:dehydrogenase [Opitutales bacterium]
MSQSRRKFIKQSALASTAFGAFAISGTKSSGKIIGANDRINVAVCGIKGRGAAHMGSLGRVKNVSISHLVDPDSRLFDGRKKFVSSRYKNNPDCIQDVRRALENKDIHAVSVATPNHWHSLISIWACQAGKDVYVEKPLSHNVWEGGQLLKAAKKYGCIVQHGTQSRSQQNWANTAKEIASGKKGKLEVSLGTCHKGRGSIGVKATKQPPAELDFDVWTGPAPKEEYHENLVHYNWHWFWNYGNGDIGNQGVHQMDIARWMIPGAKWPNSVICVGGRFGYKDQGETANTQLAIFDYGESLLVFEVRGLKTPRNVGNKQFFGKGGKQKDVLALPGVKSPIADRGQGDNFANFITAVRSRKTEDLNAHVHEGHISAALCHLPNVSLRLGEKQPFSKKNKFFGQNKVAGEYLERMQDHLKDNGVKLDEEDYIVGRHLKFDGETESFVGDDEANKLLTREYRKPFVVPEKV